MAAQTAQPCRATRHRAQRVGQARRDKEDAEHRQQVGKRCRVLEGMCAVGVEEAAAVRAEQLDDLLRSRRSLRDRLPGALHGLHGVVGLEVLDDALRDQEQRADDRERQQHPERRAHHVDPEVADRVLVLLREAPDKAIATAMPTAAETKLW